MKNGFNAQAGGILPPDFYHGAVVEDNGELKIEWNDPQEGQSLLTEQELRKREESSRNALTAELASTQNDEWKRQRNINYSAEYGLEKLQRHKIALGRTLDTPLRPVIPNP